MRQPKLFAALALVTVLLAACGGQPESKAAQPVPQSTPAKAEVAAPAPTEAPKAAEPAAAAPGSAKTVAKPVFIDFYAPW